MRIDLHIHTMVSSPCSLIDPEECVLMAMDQELDAICVTEHDSLEGGRVVREIARGKGLRCFVGMEVTSREGHLLVYGYDRDIRGVKPAAEIVEAVAAAGGIVVPAHPFRYPFGWYSGSLDTPLEDTDFPSRFRVIEMYNGQTTDENNEKARALCGKFSLFGTGGSDAHLLSEIGSCLTDFEEEIEDDLHLAAVLRGGKYKAVCVRERK